MFLKQLLKLVSILAMKRGFLASEALSIPVPIHHPQEMMVNFTIKTIQILETKHVIVITTPDEDLNILLQEIWSRDMTSEVHILPLPKQPKINQSRNVSQPSDLSLVTSPTWQFLYGRDPLPRSDVVVLVMGSADWAVSAAVYMMKKKVFGSMDTLLILPKLGQVRSSDLCPCIPLGVRVAVLQYEERKGSCEALLKEARLMEGGSYTLRSVGCYTKEDLILKRPLWPRVTSLRGAVLKIVYVKGFNEIIPVGRGKDLTLEGNLGKYLMEFKKKLNFSLEVMEVEGFGTRASNGSFSGVVGFMERWEADFGGASLSVLTERAQVLDYGDWFGIHNTRFITKVPYAVIDHFLLFKIYTVQAWLAIFGLLLASSLALMVTWDVPTGERSRDSRMTLASKAFSVTLNAALLKSSPHQPNSKAGKLMITLILLIIMVLVFVYSGSLTAFLSSPRVYRPPESIRELNTRGYVLSISEGFSQYYKMKTSPIASHQTAFKRAQFRQDRGIVPEDTYVNMIKKKPFALLVTVMGVAKVVDNHAVNVGPVKVCTLKSGTEALFQEIGAIGFPRNSPIKYLFDDITVWMRNTGLKSEPEPTCIMPNPSQGMNRPIGFLQISGVASLWAVGIIIAMLGFACEVLKDKVLRI